MARSLALQVRENHVEVAAELPQDLSACTAGRRWHLGISDDRDPAKVSMTFRDRLEHSDSFGADRQPVRGVFHIASGHYRAVGRFERGADQEMRELRVRVQACSAGGSNQIRVAQ